MATTARATITTLADFRAELDEAEIQAGQREADYGEAATGYASEDTMRRLGWFAHTASQRAEQARLALEAAYTKRGQRPACCGEPMAYSIRYYQGTDRQEMESWKCAVCGTYTDRPAAK